MDSDDDAGELVRVLACCVVLFYVVSCVVLYFLVLCCVGLYSLAVCCVGLSWLLCWGFFFVWLSVHLPYTMPSTLCVCFFCLLFCLVLSSLVLSGLILSCFGCLFFFGLVLFCVVLSCGIITSLVLLDCHSLYDFKASLVKELQRFAPQVCPSTCLSLPFCLCTVPPLASPSVCACRLPSACPAFSCLCLSSCEKSEKTRKDSTAPDKTRQPKTQQDKSLQDKIRQWILAYFLLLLRSLWELLTTNFNKRVSRQMTRRCKFPLPNDLWKNGSKEECDVQSGPCKWQENTKTKL